MYRPGQGPSQTAAAAHQQIRFSGLRGVPYTQWLGSETEGSDLSA